MSDSSREHNRTESEQESVVLGELMITPNKANSSAGGLVVEGDSSGEDERFRAQLESTLAETEREVIQAVTGTEDVSKGWEHARKVVTQFRPVPWIIWRLSNFVLGKSGEVKEVSEGLIFGLRRLMFAAASDQTLGVGDKVNEVRTAIKVLAPDVVAGVAVIHAVSRRLASQQYERIWKPILEDALLRARIGFCVGKHDPSFGTGRGMLAGFAGRCGLAILIATGELEQARNALEQLATGADIRDVGWSIYKSEPLQVSAMTLSAAGCGRDAAFGTAAYGSLDPSKIVSKSKEQSKWLAAFAICEAVRTSTTAKIAPEFWQLLGFETAESKNELIEDAKKVIRRGHGWGWLM